MQKKKQFIINIAPITRISLENNQSFSYLYQEKLPEGTLVTIPLFKRKLLGIVLESKKDFKRMGNIKLKSVSEVIEKNFLTKKQLQLAIFISDYYISSLGTVLKFFVPKRMKARKKTPGIKKLKSKKIILNKKQQEAIKEISSRNSKFLLYGPSGSGKTEVYIHSIKKLRSKNPEAQFLILLPELTLTPQALERYGQHFPQKEIVVLNSKISKGQFFENWKKIKSGQAKIIIASRMGTLAPFFNLKLIVIDEEQDLSFKQWDMNPRYDARKVAEKLATLHQAKIIFGSSTPRIETFQRALKKEIKLLNLPSIKKSPKAHLLDMRLETWKKKNKNFSLSHELKSAIDQTLNQKGQAILLINRQGMSNFSICSQCKEVFLCPKCERALIYDSQGYYYCLHCSYKTSVFPTCPKCGNIEFENLGTGTQKIEKEINTFFPSAKVSRVDSQSTKKAGSQEKIYENFSQGHSNILIGTQMISKGWDLPEVSLVGIIDIDNLLSFPDFYTNEKVFSLIMQASGRTNRPGSKKEGKVIIQTFQPQNYVLKLAAQKDYKSFFEREIKERKMLNLPPFGRIIKIVFQDRDFQKVTTESKKVFEKIEKIKNPVLRISPPQKAFVPKSRGRYRNQIIIKNKGKKVSENLKRILKKLPAKWTIDIDSITIN